jgi:hypothetical protein
MPRLTDSLHKYVCTFMIISRRILLRIKSVLHKTYIENQNTHFMLKNIFSESHYFYEIMWKNIAHPDRLQIAIRRMRIACWITKATDTHSEYIILIAFPRRQ